MKKLKAVIFVTLIVASLMIISTQAEARLDEEKYGELARQHNERTYGHEQEAAGAANFVGVGIALGLIALGVWLLVRRQKHFHKA